MGDKSQIILIHLLAASYRALLTEAWEQLIEMFAFLNTGYLHCSYKSSSPRTTENFPFVLQS